VCLWEFEISEAVNDVLDNDIMGQCSSGDDSDFCDDYTQLVTPGIHTISNNDSERTVTHDGMGGVSMKFVRLYASWETFCAIYSP
jgi:hypothetical protein